MKKLYSLIALVLIALLAGHSKLQSYSNGFFGGGYTGSPGDFTQTCATCHSGSPVTVAANAITSTIPATGYVPGQTYTITLTATHPTSNRFGFQITAESANNSKAGTWVVTNTSETHISPTHYVAHTSGGTMGSNNSKSWSMNWTAPAVGTGAVTFYAVINRVNNNSGTNGDQVATATLSVSENSPPPPPPVLVLNIDTVLSEVCLGDCQGAVVASATGGVPPYNFSIAGGNFTGLCEGNYWVYVTDSINQIDSAQVAVGAGAQVTKPSVFTDFSSSPPLLYTVNQAAAYQWYYNGSPIPVTKDTLIFTVDFTPSNGEYQVEAFNADSCSSISDSVFVTFSNVKSFAQNFKIYPNPLRNPSVKVDFEGARAQIRLMDLQGKIIIQRQVSPGEQVIIPAHVPNGVYLLHLENERGKSHLKLLVDR
jgi:hypothetical protein